MCLALLVPMVIINPVRFNTQTPLSRWLSIGLTALLAAANTVALVQLVVQLVQAKSDEDGTLLLAAAQVWTTNVIVFALIYWELDRGGPVIRTLAARKDLPQADIRFPQDEDRDTVSEVSKGSSVEEQLDGRLHRLPVLLGEQQHGVQPTGCAAADRAREDPGRTAGAGRLRASRPGDRAGRCRCWARSYAAACSSARAER